MPGQGMLEGPAPGWVHKEVDMSVSLDQATAIVTGGSRGYGYGIAGALRQNGAEVWITGRDAAALDQAAGELGVHALAADVTRPEDWDRVFKTVLDEQGRVDILVNNAGGGIRIAPMTEQTDESIEQIVALNLTGQLYGCRRAATVMGTQRDGMIINISSGCAIHAWPGWGPYSAAKAGLNQFAHCLYTELRDAGVRVTTITPYWGATDFLTAARLEGHPAGDPEIRKQTMQPDDMGQLVVDVCRTPAHLVLPDITVQPLVQQIEPM
jgi:NAD(P)-dependent dehydrogenase (short-subunit alcohol dehydrogenase family)